MFLSYTFNTPDQWGSSHILNTPFIWRFRLSYILKTPAPPPPPAPIGRCQFFMGFIIYLKHPRPPWGDSGLSYIFKHAPHLAIPVHHIYLNTPLIWRFRLSYTFNTPDQGGFVIYLKHAPRLGDSGSSFSFKHAPRLAIPSLF